MESEEISVRRRSARRRSHRHEPVLTASTLRRGITPASSPAETVLGLQRTVGNQVVQRLLAPGGQARSNAATLPIQRKMDWKNTKWSSANFLDASRGGGGGVLFVGEKGYEVVVKPGEEAAAEGAMAALLHNEVGQSNKHKLVTAPGTRIAVAKERQQIKAALTPLVANVGSNVLDQEDRDFKNNRAKDLVGRLDEPGVVVQDVGAGQEFEKAIRKDPNKKHTEKAFFGGRKLRKESELRIFKDVRAIQALGETTAVDLYVGNKDRLIQFNMENIMVTPYSLTMIDNIWIGGGMASFQKTTVQDHDGNHVELAADEALSFWKTDWAVQALASGDFNRITSQVWDMVNQRAADGARKKDKAALQKVMAPYESRFKKTFNAGLAAGKKKLIASINSLIKDPARLQQVAPGVDLTEILASMRKRRDFLQGS